MNHWIMNHDQVSWEGGVMIKQYKWEMEDQNQYHVLFSNYEKKVQARKELTVESAGKCIFNYIVNLCLSSSSSSTLYLVYCMTSCDLYISDGTNFESNAVSLNVNIPLAAERHHFRGQACISANKYIPEPCLFPFLRWTFSFLAACVLLFVFLIFLYLVYDVITMEL